MSNGLQIVIPTHARPDRQITLTALPPALRSRTLLVTSVEQDAVRIRELYDHPARQILVSGCRTIAQKRHWIMEHIKAETIFMMDDDIVFFRRCDPAARAWNAAKGQWDVTQAGVTLMEQAAPEDFTQAFKLLERAAHEGHAAVAIAHRMHNNRVQDSWLYCARMMYAFGVRTDIYKRLRLRFDEVECREDFNVTLRLLRAGYTNAVFCEFMTDPRAAFNSAGGASTTRTVQQSDAEAHKLARLHPGLVKVVQKNYKGGGGKNPDEGDEKNTRMEVIVQWKRAYMEGQNV